MTVMRWVRVMGVGVAIASSATWGCGGASPEPTTPTGPQGSASASASASVGLTEPPPGVSVVRFDDLGVSFAVPPGFHVMGDDALAAQIRASGSPRLTAALRERAPEKKGLPLLTLTKEASSPGDALTLTLTATVLPADATPAELLAQQQTVMKDNLEGFTITDGPREDVRDGVHGLELSDRYGLRSAAAAAASVRKVASMMRLYVRNGLAFAIVAVWSDGSAHGDEATALLDGLHFYDAKP